MLSGTQLPSREVARKAVEGTKPKVHQIGGCTVTLLSIWKVAAQEGNF